MWNNHYIWYSVSTDTPTSHKQALSLCGKKINYIDRLNRLHSEVKQENSCRIMTVVVTWGTQSDLGLIRRTVSLIVASHLSLIFWDAAVQSGPPEIIGRLPRWTEVVCLGVLVVFRYQHGTDSAYIHPSSSIWIFELADVDNYNVCHTKTNNLPVRKTFP